MTYKETIEAWRRERNETIRTENGWLALAGLYWLKLGKNQFGSDSKNEIQLPDRVPANVGYFEYNGKSVSLRTNLGHKVKVNNTLTDFAILQTDITENPSCVNLQDVQLVVIQRGNKMGVRMWDNQSDKRLNFPARSWYNIDVAFRLPATFTAYDRPKMAYFPDLTGEKAEFPVEGCLTFQHNGKTYCKIWVNGTDPLPIYHQKETF